MAEYPTEPLPTYETREQILREYELDEKRISRYEREDESENAGGERADPTTGCFRLYSANSIHSVSGK
jgi:hypothetical protein